MSGKRARLRDLGVAIGRYPTGPNNAITDVGDVMVGHSTIIQGSGPLQVGRGPIRTGVTAILPNGGRIFTERVVGGAFILNGAGEVSGLIQVMEWGLIETPILLTNTLSVGAASSALVGWMTRRHPQIGVEDDVIIPLVGECDDSFLNDIGGRHIHPEHVEEALDNAKGGPVAEGSVGGGTGMVAFDLKGGIGTSSRVLPERSGGFTVGVLVMSNVGRLQDLRIDGIPVGGVIKPVLEGAALRRTLYGSIICVLATDAPLTTHQIGRLCKRVALGIGRVGSYAAHGSGEIILGFTTSNPVPRGGDAPTYQLSALPDRRMNALYGAAIECTEEAILNALCAAEPMVGLDDRYVPALPLEPVVEAVTRCRAVLAEYGDR